MISARSTRVFAPIRIVWLLVAVTLAAGYFLVLRGPEQRIAERNDGAEQMAAATQRNGDLLRRRPLLERRKRAADARLSQLRLDADRSGAVALFVRETARIAGDCSVRVVQIALQHDAPVQPPGSEAFGSTVLDLTIAGAYRDVLRTVRGISRGRVLARVDVASLERSTAVRTGGPADVQARLRITLQHAPAASDHRKDGNGVLPASG